MSDSSSSELGKKLSDSDLISSIGKVMAVIIIVLCLVVISVFLLHLYAKWFWYRRPEGGANNLAPTSRRRHHLDFSAGHQETAVATIHGQGLDPSVLKTLPIIVFTQKDFNEKIECAVCLCGVCEGEKARFLPKCNHGFHMECIDMWFQSHASCPLCRNPVSLQSDKNNNQESARTTEGELRIHVEDNVRMFPTNVRTSASSSSDANRAEGVLAINEEEAKTSISPRLRSFMRLLSRDSRRVNPSSTHDLDVEQGGRNQN